MSDNTAQFEANEAFFKALAKLTETTHLLEAQVEKEPDTIERHPLMHFDAWFIIAALGTGVAITHSNVTAEWVENLWFLQIAFILAALITNLSRPRTTTVVHSFNISRLRKPRPKTSLASLQAAHGIAPVLNAQATTTNIYRGKFPLDAHNAG